MNNYKLFISFDGTDFSGWQRLGGNAKTIQGTFEACLSRMTGAETEIFGCGRTDAGVHAEKYVANFKTQKEFDPLYIKEYLNRYLPQSINVFSCETADERFHSRLCAKKKTYRYRIWNSEEHNVFERKYLYTFPHRLDVAAMESAAERLIGTHDFIGFSSLKKTKKSTVRNIYSAEIIQNFPEIDIEITANGFIYNMMRIISGTLLEIGCGRQSENLPDEIFASKDRFLAGFTVPASGLIMKDVVY